MAVFDSVLIANRGEIAVRVIRTLDRLGIRSIAVYSDADADAMHVRAASAAIRIGPADARRSYLDVAAVVRAARDAGAQAIHPGYGFLAESAALARACRSAGVAFIGPPPEAIETMGDKIRARAAVQARGVATVPGVSESALDDAPLVAGAERVGFPVLIKPALGGGGKGMHRVDDPASLPDALAQARRESTAAFGDDTVFLERFVTNPRHVEVQILADEHGGVIHLGERECSLQRRHQKVVEEAPSPLLSEGQRARIGRAACETARAVGYVGAGTVEFIVSDDHPDEPFFMEMNTRLQVEHPVTEAVVGIDLVEQQLRVAAGDRLDLAQEDVRITGHAIEARIYAEDPVAGFAPTGGEALLVEWPEGDGVRVDAGIASGDVVSSHYDPMLAKAIAHAATRGEALDHLDAALADTRVLGMMTNVAFLRALVADPEVRAGRLDTGLIDRHGERLARIDVPDDVFAQAGRALIEHGARGTRAWVPDGWRIGGAVGSSVRLRDGAGVATVTVLPAGTATRSVAVRVARERGTSQSRLLADPPAVAVVSGGVWLSTADGTWFVEEARNARRGRAGQDPALASPMPGTVVAVHAADGDEVAAGDALVSIEAMKMEHVLRAPVAGTASIDVRVGDRVSRGQDVAVVRESEES